MLTDPLFSDAEIDAMAVRAMPAQEHLRAAVVGALRDMRLRYEADRLALVAALQEEIGHADARVESARETVATVLRSSEIQVYAVRLPAGTWLGHDKYGATEEDELRRATLHATAEEAAEWTGSAGAVVPVRLRPIGVGP